jgi:hypothetical protein
MRTLEDVHGFIREHPEFGYQSLAEIEREMDVADERINLDLDERILPWITVLLDTEARDELKATAWRMIYLTGFLDAKAGKPL